MDLIDILLAKRLGNGGDLSLAIMNPKGMVPYKSQLPVTDNKKGDIYVVTSDKSEWIWLSENSSGTLSDYENFGAMVDMSAYRTAIAQDEIDNQKQNKITTRGILKADGDGNIYTAFSGRDYLTEDTLPFAYKTSDSGIITIVDGLTVRNYNGNVTINFKSPYKSTESANGAYKTLHGSTLPLKFRPLDKLRFPISIGGKFAEIIINPDGSMQQFATFDVSEGEELRGTISYSAKKPPVIIKYPEDVTVSEGDDVSFLVIADGDDLHYEWRCTTGPGVPETLIEDSDYNVLYLGRARQDMDGKQYVCYVSNDYGTEVTGYAGVKIIN